MKYLSLLLLFAGSSLAAYNEAPCRALGGTCKGIFSSCSNGKRVSGKCPSQSFVKCCVPNYAATTTTRRPYYSTAPPYYTTTTTRRPPGGSGSFTSTCSSVGGTCMSYTRCSGLSVSRLCPGSSANRCCVTPFGVDDTDRHINREEGGIYLTGYIPTAGSGVTIATGVDLGQQSDSGLRTLGVSSSIRSRLRPYLGLRTRDEVRRAGLRESDLRLTLAQARELDGAFKRDLVRRTDRYDNRLGNKGKAVLRSLTHWCYNVTDDVSDDKCYIRGCTNYLRNALLRGQCTDRQLRDALRDQKRCAERRGRPEWVRSRLQNEIDFLY